MGEPPRWPLTHVEVARDLLNGRVSARWVRERLRKLGRGKRYGRKVLLWEEDFRALADPAAQQPPAPMSPPPKRVRVRRTPSPSGQEAYDRLRALARSVRRKTPPPDDQT